MSSSFPSGWEKLGPVEGDSPHEASQLGQGGGRGNTSTSR